MNKFESPLRLSSAAPELDSKYAGRSEGWTPKPKSISVNLWPASARPKAPPTHPSVLPLAA